jgi:hypothetical protein
MTLEMLIVKVVGKKTKDFRRADINIAILSQKGKICEVLKNIYS